MVLPFRPLIAIPTSIPMPIISSVPILVASPISAIVRSNSWLIRLLIYFFHGFLILLLKVFADLLDNAEERVGWLPIFLIFFVHLCHKLNKRVLYFFRCAGKDHHNEVFHEIFSVMKIFRGLIIHQRRIMKFVESSKIHRYFIIQPHQFRRLVKVLQIFVMVQHLDHTLHQLPIDIHRILIETVVEVVRQLLILSLTIRRIRQIILVERVLEDVFGLHHVSRTPSHYYNRSPCIQSLSIPAHSLFKRIPPTLL
jgi:hypothetical protein